MQTDSHMDFSDNFDTQLIEMFHRTKNDYAVLSTYVADISQNNQDVRVVPNLCSELTTNPGKQQQKQQQQTGEVS